jgi:pimeloyl-ACP methyl ester carboxylesterase
MSMTQMNRLSRLPTSVRRNRKVAASHSYAVAAVVAAGALAATALLNRHLAKKAEHDNPPAGEFLEVSGVRLHYVERGTGEPLVLLHGNGSMIQDFESSGLVNLAAKNYRVIIIDRPGFGYSSRPRNVVWTPDAQAQLIRRALERLGVSQAIVLGHSWGASVAVALALKFPDMVGGLVLASGYYYPTLRPDVGPVRPGNPRCGRYSGPHAVTDDKPANVAADDSENLRTEVGACQIREVPEGDGASSFTDPCFGRRVGAHDPGRIPFR